MHQPVSRRHLLTGLGGAALAALLGCARPAAVRPSIEGFGPMPTWLATAPAQVQDLYRWAAGHKSELAYIPCFCGCGGDAFRHRNNYDCYFANNAYDQHAYG